MNKFLQIRKALATAVLVLLLTITTACSSGSNVAQLDRPGNSAVLSPDKTYSQLERGNTANGQNFGSWVVSTSHGLVKDAYVRDNNKLGVVISPQVRPQEVQTLTKSLLQGFHKNFPNQDLKVLVYAPDKKLILTADYDVQTNKIQYT
jgi:hypothetical protein